METEDFNITEARPEETPELTAVMKAAFDNDSQRHLGRERGGPPGYDTGEFIRKNAFHPRARTFTAKRSGKIVGCIITFPGKDGHHWVGCMFTHPVYQRLGVGHRLFAHAEREIPGKSWSLETPAFAVSNHLFYEKKCGMIKTGETDGSQEPGVQYIYRKTCC